MEKTCPYWSMTKKVLLRLVALVLTFGLYSNSAAQSQPIQFEHLSVSDGLSDNSVSCMLQDREGFMWFGTNEGLNKYDGYRFTVFQPDATRPDRSFQSSRITGLCEGRSNQLWVVTEGGGLHEVNKQRGTVRPHPIPAPATFRWNNQLSVYEDSQGMLWISTFAGLARYEPARHHFTLYPAPRLEVPIKTVFEDRQHRFWVATNRGLYLFDRSTGRFTLLPVPNCKGAQPAFISFYLDESNVLWLGTASTGYSLFKLDLNRQPWQLVPYNPGGQLNSFVFMNSIHQDRQGLIWMGTVNGVQTINPVTNKIGTCRTDPNSPKGLSSNSAQAVYHDRTGVLWIGTDNGVDRQATTIKPFKTYQVTPHTGIAVLPENKVVALLSNYSGQLWLSNQKTVYRLMRPENQFEAVPVEKLGTTKKHINLICGLLTDTKRGIWLATTDGLYHVDPLSGHYTGYQSEIPAQFIARAPSGTIWIGGEGGLASFNPRSHQYQYYKYDPSAPGGLPDRYVHGLMVSRTGDVWVLIKRLGLCRLNPENGRFKRYLAGPAGQLSTNDVQTIYEDPQGIVWVGTHWGGLNRFDPQTGLFSVITHQEGILGTTITGIINDKAGTLWVSTDNGLCQLNSRTGSIRRYDQRHGLPSNNFMANAVFRQKEQLFFGSLNGVVQFNPAFIQFDVRSFPVYITALTVMNRPYPLTGKPIRLSYNENFLSFEFSALAYALPQQNQYACQLVGIDKDWVQNGKRHVADYPNLPPGHYLFKVKAANSDGQWNQAAIPVTLIIIPPWWQTTGFRLTLAILLLLVAGTSIRFYTRTKLRRQSIELKKVLLAQEEERQRLAADLHDDLGATLSVIKGQLETVPQPHNGLVQSLRLMEKAIQSLRHISHNLMPPDFAKLGLTEALRETVRRAETDSSLQVVFITYGQERRLDPEKELIIYRIALELINNAIKHAKARQITIQLLFYPQYVSLLVEDDGQGYPTWESPTQEGIGLRNICSRVTYLKSTLAVDSGERGTTVTVDVPV